MVALVMPTPSRQETMRGILYSLLAFLLFSVGNALSKWLVVRYSVIEIVAFRAVISLVPCLLLIAATGGTRLFRTSRIGGHAVRALLSFMAMTTIVYAFRLIPLADAVAVTFSAPLFITLLSAVTLGETIGGHRWAALFLGFAGVLVILQPGSGVLAGGAVFALASAMFGAVATISVRRLSLTEPSATIVFYQTSIVAVIAAAALPFLWVTPDWSDFGLLVLIGLVAGVGQYFWTESCRLAHASAVAPIFYTQILWSTALGFLIWNDLPTGDTLIGGAIVIASTFYIFYREASR